MGVIRCRNLWASLFMVLINGTILANTIEQTIFKIKVSKDGRQALLKQSLNGIAGAIQSHLEDAPLNDKFLQANPADCTKEKMDAMGSLEIWKKCPGIPDYFFKDGSYFSGYRPRLVTLSLSDIRVNQASLGHIKTLCDNDSCVVEIPLNNLELSSNIDISQKRASSRFSAGQKILSIPGSSVRIAPNTEGDTPVLKLKAKFNNTASSPQQQDSIISFDPSESRLNIPSGSVRVSLPGHLDQSSVSELLEQSGVLTVNQYVFSGLLTIASQLNGDLYELYQLLDLNLPVNDHLNDPSKIMNVNHLANTRLLPTLLELVNDGISQSMIFKGTKIDLPSGGLQDLFDQPKMISRLDSLDTDIRQTESQLLKARCFGMSNLKKHQQFLSTGVSSSKSNTILERLTATEKQISHLKYLARQVHCDQALESLNVLQDSLRGSVKKISTNIAALQQQLDLRLDIQKSAQIPGQLTVILSELTGTGELQADSQQSIDSAEQTDLSGFVSFHTLNTILDLAWQQKRFDICVSSDPEKTCTQPDGDDSKTLIYCPEAPGIFWDNDQQEHFLSVKLKGQSQVSEYKLWLKPYLNESDDLSFSHRLEFTNGQDQHETEALFLGGLLRFMQSIHPLLNKLLPEEIKIRAMDSYEDNVSVELPWLNMNRVVRNERGIFFSGHLVYMP